MKLHKTYLEKPWGRTELPAAFEGPQGSRIGEIIYAAPPEMQLPLLLKFIFTSEKLSVQVHPDDRLGRAKGYAHGKSECWYIVDAEPKAKIALGFRSEADAATVRAAALDGSIEQILQWKAVEPGDFFYVPAGTVHAIGGGITLLEVQQNLDVTYRLFDYGRLRELHLADAIEAARLQKYDPAHAKGGSANPRQVLVSGEHFSVLKIEGKTDGADELADRARWVVPIRGQAASGGEVAYAGDCMYLAPGEPLGQSDDALTLISVEGPIQ